MSQSLPSPETNCSNKREKYVQSKWTIAPLDTSMKYSKEEKNQNENRKFIRVHSRTSQFSVSFACRLKKKKFIILCGIYSKTGKDSLSLSIYILFFCAQKVHSTARWHSLPQLNFTQYQIKWCCIRLRICTQFTQERTKPYMNRTFRCCSLFHNSIEKRMYAYAYDTITLKYEWIKWKKRDMEEWK